jgi:thioredoxin reductase (NADPH)
LITSDIAIIGAGPVGLFTVFQAGMLGLQSVVIDTLDFIGGQCNALYPEKPIFDIPAHPKILASELIEQLYNQAKPFAPKMLLNNMVESISQMDSKWIIETSKGQKIIASVIIIAAGCGAFGPNKPPLDNIEEYEGKSIFYMVTKKEEYRDKTIVIAGGGDSAVDWANILSEIAKKVYVVHRRNKFRALPENVNTMYQIAESGKIEMLIPYQLAGLRGEKGYLKEIEVVDLDNNPKIINADILLPFFGLSMDLGPITKWGINIEKKHLIVDPSTMQTNHSGIFAVGDITNYPGKLKLILSGFSEAAIACHSAYSIIYPDKPLHFEYSTNKGIPS